MNYLVTSSPPSNPPTKTIGASDRMTTISGLTNGTPYTFNVVVKYADGTSSVSKESSSVTPTLPAPTVATTTTLPVPTVATTTTLPAPTVTITATAGSKKATINITRPSPTTTRAISKYEITSIPYITPIIVSTVPVPVNYSRDITGLTKRKKYKFTVKAFYSGGTVSAISNEITVK